jgi:hypothetical protein
MGVDVGLDADGVRAAVTLAMSSLQQGSSIDVYCAGCFWEAVIVSVSAARLKFRFLHTGQRQEFGWVSKRDFLRSWRFPVRSEADALRAVLIAECVAPLIDEC